MPRFGHFGLILPFNRNKQDLSKFYQQNKILHFETIFVFHPTSSGLCLSAETRAANNHKVQDVFTVYLNPTKTILALEPSPTSSSSFHLWFTVGIRIRKHLITWLLIIWFSDHGHILNTGLKTGIQILG